MAAIPPGHYHLRLVLEFKDGTRVVLHEATVAAIVRAYVSIVTHPSRRGVMLVSRRLTRAQRKIGYAEWQLIEGDASEDEAISEVVRVLSDAEVPRGCLGENEARER
ncbi:hypothetical protein [Pyrolobus fumarii]|uniref:hypothetical protein n=1 Tax=Pyrolobus fumarii TaxID=54252 RepID=UPI001FCAE9F6|nr:hypothetical protein [Pyrolobus fumarii]